MTRGRPARRPDAPPRRVRHGIKLRARDGEPQPANWLAAQWLDLLRARFTPEQLAEGLRFARSGQTIALEVQPGRIEATVQGRAPRPAKVTLRTPAFTGEQWDAIIDAMAGEALFAARLTTGEVPEAIDTLLGSFHLRLLPQRPDDLRLETDGAADEADTLGATVAYLLADRFGDEPLTALTLRGMAAEMVIERLRQARAIRTHGAASAHADPRIPQTRRPAAPLETCIDEFWRSGPALKKFLDEPAPAHAPHALLRRLGPSPLNGRFPLVGLLASVYDEVSNHARRMQDDAERLVNGGPPPPA